MAALERFFTEGDNAPDREVKQADWERLAEEAVTATRSVYPRTKPEQLREDLALLMESLIAIAQGQEPPVEVGTLSLGDYAPYMSAPHRMDLMVSAMTQDGAWHCNQKCLHCYAAGQPMGESRELTTAQWKEALERLRRANIPQVTFTGGEPTLRADLVELVEAAQWFVTRLNTNGRLLTPELCRRLYEASLDSVQVTLYSADAAVHNTLVGAPGFDDTVQGVRNAVAAGLMTSVNTPLCSLNRDYAATLRFVHELGVRYVTCSGLIPSGGAETEAQSGHPPDTGGADCRAASGRGDSGGAGHGDRLHQSRLAAGGNAPEPWPAPDPQLRGLPEQHGRHARRTGGPLPELAGRHHAGEPPYRRLVRHLGRRDLPGHPGQERQAGAYLPAGRGKQRGVLTMKKTICRALLCLLLAACLLPLTARTAHADKIYDEIVNYQVDVTPNTEDGSLAIQVTLDWKPLEDLPATNSQQGGAKIGIPNGSIREMTALTDNIQSIDHDNSLAYIDFTQSYDANETFHFAFRWVQEYMYTLSDSGAVSYDYTPGWFKEAPVDAMTLTWHDPASVAGVGSDGQTGGDHVLTASNMEPGDRLNFTVEYASWPSTLYWENSRDNLPDNSRGDDSYDDSDDSDNWVFTVFVIFVLVIFFVARAAVYDGYAGGFGTRYVFVHGLWYPAGPDGRHPRPGSVGTKHKPAPPRSSGFGGGKRGGGFGGGGFGGGSSHCACASSCACACACACAGGGRAGCSAKNLYGAVKLSEELTENL